MDKNKKLLLAIYIVLVIALFVFGFKWLQAEALYHEAIKQGSENTLTAIQMVVACQELSNVTTEQIKEQFIKTFVKIS